MTTEDVALALLKSQIERCILQMPCGLRSRYLQFKLQAAKFDAEMDALAGADLDKAMSVGEAHEEALWYINHVKGEADATES